MEARSAVMGKELPAVESHANEYTELCGGHDEATNSSVMLLVELMLRSDLTDDEATNVLVGAKQLFVVRKHTDGLTRQ